MRLFITGASGYVGSVVTEMAVRQGHEVVGLVRSDQGADKVRALGATPCRGSLEDTAALATAARAADAVLHLAFVHEFDRPYAELLETDIAAIRAMGAALEGSGKVFISTSGTSVVEPDNGAETDEASPLASSPLRRRGEAEQETTGLAARGVRAMVIRLAPYVYGRGGSYFLPINMLAAARHGFAFYVGDGAVMTSAGEVDATAALYLRALHKGAAGGVYNCTTETSVRIKDLAQAIAAALGVGTRSVTFEQAGELLGSATARFLMRDKTNEMYGAWTAQFLVAENRASSSKAKRDLGWQPHPRFSFCDDIVRGSYRNMAAELKAQAARSRG